MENERAAVAPYAVPDATAVRVALWRALHVELDAPPVLEDTIGLRLAAPPQEWRSRPDMHPQGTRGYRAAVVARARFIEDLVVSQAAAGVAQYVVLGAGLDSFAQRRPEMAGRVTVFEVDQPDTQAWKRRRLRELGFGEPAWLRFVPVDFERQDAWQELAAAGFAAERPAVVASTGVSMYLTREANLAVLRRASRLAPGSTFATTFLLPTDLVDAAERAQYEDVQRRARAAGTPFVSLFAPQDMLALAREVGLRQVEYVSTADLVQRYFADRSDGLRPASGEAFLLATT